MILYVQCHIYSMPYHNLYVLLGWLLVLGHYKEVYLIIFMPPFEKGGAYCVAHVGRSVCRSVGMSVGRYVSRSVCR